MKHLFQCHILPIAAFLGMAHAVVAATPAMPAATAVPDTTFNLAEIAVTEVKQTAGEQIGNSAVTALGRSTIERLNITSSKALSAIAPNFFIPDYGSRMTSSVYVRGIGARIDQPAVGLNIDDIPILNKDAYDFDLLDIAGIQMMRGPQSTLYGRNTMGGLISITTLSPLSYQGVRILAEYGSANSVKAGVSAYLKPSDSFGISAGISAYRTDGFFENAWNHENCDKEKSLRATFKAEWMPTEALAVKNTATFSVVRQGGYAYQSVATGQINYNDTCFYRRNAFMDGFSVKWDMGNAILSSTTSYQFLDDNMTLDQDFLPVSYFTLTQQRKEHTVTEDIFVRSNTDSRFSWLGGLFGFYRHANINAPVTFKDYGIEQLIENHWNENNSKYPLYWDNDRLPLLSSFTTPSFGGAAYAEMSAETGQFTFTAGVRLDVETARLSYDNRCNTSYTVYEKLGTTGLKPYLHRPVDINMQGSLERTFTQLLPRFSIVYRLPASSGSVYFSLAKGYKAGGYNTQMFSDVLQQELMSILGFGRKYAIDDIVGYDPETSWNYEIGGRLSFFDDRLTTDFAAFYIDCRNQQLTVFPDGTTTGRIMANAGRTRSTGVEITVAARPVNRLVLRASYGYTNARFKDFDNGKENYAGNFIPYAPQNTIFAATNYSFAIPGSSFLRYISVGIDVTGIGRIYWNESNTCWQDFYALLGASVKLGGNHYSLDLWSKNMTDTQYSTFYFVSIEHEFLQQGKPARFGATLRLNF